MRTRFSDIPFFDGLMEHLNEVGIGDEPAENLAEELSATI